MSKNNFIFLVISLIVFGFLIFGIKNKPQEIEVKAGQDWEEPCQVEKRGCKCKLEGFVYKCSGELSCEPFCDSRANAIYTDPDSTCIYEAQGNCHVGEVCGIGNPDQDICFQDTSCNFGGGNCEYYCKEGFANCNNDGPGDGCECEKPASCCDGNIRRYDCAICDSTNCNSNNSCSVRVGCKTQDCGQISYCSTDSCIICPDNFLNCDGNPANGCEIDVSSDNNNCGDCGITCEADENCVNGLCVSSASADVWGWAWSKNIGWISFNCINKFCRDPITHELLDDYSCLDTSCVDNGGECHNSCIICNEKSATGRTIICDSECTDCCGSTGTGDCVRNDYGVTVDSGTGEFSGYAWSENIGWIKFDPPPDFDTGRYPCCSSSTCPGGPDSCGDTDEWPNYPVCLDIPDVSGEVCDGVGDYLVSGWARACAGTVNRDCESATRTDGWDGWILLGPISKQNVDFGVNYVATDSGEFHNWAWGSNVVGWISFWGSNPTIFPPSNLYVVSTDFTLPNQPPYVQGPQIIQENYCLNSPTGQVSFQWTYMDKEGDEQAQYHLQVSSVDFSDPSFGTEDLVVDSIISQPDIASGEKGTSAVSVLLTPTPERTDLDIGYNLTYYWRVRVKAESGSPLWSDWEKGPSFTTPLHPYPHVEFNWSPTLPVPNQDVQFCSILESGVCETEPARGWTTCYDADGNCDNWYWTFYGGTPGSSTEENPIIQYPSPTDKTIELTVKDSDGYSCSKTHNLAVGLSLPGWKEIPPL